MQLCYYRGHAEFRASEWLTHASALLDQMAGVTCLAGATQIGRLITHALQAGSVNQPVRALVFVGDACEEGRDYLYSLAGQCGIRKLPLFLFQEGHDAQTRAIFQELARLSGGATIPFDAGSAERLRMLLRAVANFARGGIKALQKGGDEGERLLLEALQNRS